MLIHKNWETIYRLYLYNLFIVFDNVNGNQYRNLEYWINRDVGDDTPENETMFMFKICLSVPCSDSHFGGHFTDINSFK